MKHIASDRAQEALLRSYLDRMTDLLLENHLRDSGKDSEVLAVAKAWTVTVMRRLDQTRTTSLLTFLTESKLISTQDTIRLLAGADLSDASLHEVNLSNADLSEAYLSEADLSQASLMGADLSKAILSGAILSGAILIRANLSEAVLYWANLRSAKLMEANLHGVDLSGSDLRSADLRGADLRGADLSEADLRDTDLSKARYDANTQWPEGFTPPSEAVGIENSAGENPITT